jgi:hypothetical protein
MTDLANTFARKPTFNEFGRNNLPSFSGNFNSSSKPTIDARIRNKPGSRKGGKARRTLRQSLQKAYNNQQIGQFANSGMKFSNVTLKKRKHGNIFSGERTIDFDTAGVRIDRTILPKGNLTSFNSPNGSFVVTTPRLSGSKNKNESTFALKRQIKDLREMLKERDQEIMAQRMSLNISNINAAYDEKDILIQENQELKNRINILTSGGNTKTIVNDKELAKLKRENEELKYLLDKTNSCKFCLFGYEFSC